MKIFSVNTDGYLKLKSLSFLFFSVVQLLKTVQELKESHRRLEIKQEQSHTLMMKMFKQLLRSNKKNRRSVRSTKSSKNFSKY